MYTGLSDTANLTIMSYIQSRIDIFLPCCMCMCVTGSPKYIAFVSVRAILLLHRVLSYTVKDAMGRV